MSKIIVANFIHQVMTASPELVDKASSFSPRKIWYAHDKDMVVSSCPVSEYFKQYACSITGATAEHIEVLCPDGKPDAFLVQRLREDKKAYQTLLDFAGSHSNVSADVYMQDQITTDFFAEAGIPIQHYHKPASPNVVDVIERINTKSGFRDIATALNIRTVPGTTVQGAANAQKVARDLFQQLGPLMIKIDRGMNGHGQLIIHDETDINHIPASLNKFIGSGELYTIEKLMTFVSLPSIEFEITESGPRKTYDCSMRCVNNAWTGMITPAHDLSSHNKQLMNEWGERLADYLYQQGFRGTVDIDGGVTEEGTIYANESNCRHTGGSYAHFLLERLKGADYLTSTTWLADSRVSANDKTFEEGVEALYASGLAWDTSRGDGVILTTDSREIDKKWHYLVIANTPDQALDTEQQLFATLGI